MSQQQGCDLVAGASGTVGQAAVRHFGALDGWQVLALSLHPPEHAGTGRVRRLAVDLLDANACRAAADGL